MKRFNIMEHEQELRSVIESWTNLWHYLVNMGGLTVQMDEEIDRRISGLERILRHLPDEDGNTWLTEQEAEAIGGYYEI